MIKRPKPQTKIPVEAKIVFEGELFTVVQWQQEMFDGSAATWEILKRDDTVTVIPVTTDGKILIAKQEQPAKPPYTSLFGGRIEPGEDPAKAATRELMEESGYKTQKLELLKGWQPVSKMDYATYIFVAHNCQKISEQKLDPGEKIEVTAVNFDEFLEICFSQNFSEMQLVNYLASLQYHKKLSEFAKKLGVDN